MRLNGQLEKAQLENASSDPSNLPDGLLWLNTTSNKAKAYYGSATRVFVTERQGTQTIANNQAATDVTGCLVSSSVCKSAIVTYEIRRVTTSTGATEVVEAGTFGLTYNALATTWRLNMGSYFGDDAGVTLTVTSGGQVQYASSDMSSGTYDGSNSILKFNIREII